MDAQFCFIRFFHYIFLNQIQKNMIKFIEVLKDLSLNNGSNGISILRKGRYELMYSNSTISGYDIEVDGNLIKAGIYLAGQQHQDFTTYVSFKKDYWNNLVREYEPNLESIEDQLEYDFYSALNPVFHN